MKAQSNKIHLLLKISFQINKDVDNQQKRKLQALKVVHFKCKSKTRKTINPRSSEFLKYFI